MRWVWCVGLGLVAAGAVLALLYFRERPDTIPLEAPLLVRELGIAPGMTVAEVGAGDGRMAVAIAGALQGGRMIVTEIDPARLAELRRQAGGRVTVVEGAADDARLPAACCDHIYSRRVFHHFGLPAPMNASLYRALRPGGRMAVIDAPARLSFNLLSPMLSGPRNRWGHGISSDSVVEELRAAGFRLERVREWPDRNYCVIVSKPGN